MMFDCPVCGHKKNIPQTNADRIRAMSDEELMKYVGKQNLCYWIDYCRAQGKCDKCILDWLKQPVKDGE